MLNFHRAIVLAAHTDDGEFGCGGTLARLVEQGTAVYYVAFSICEASVPEGFPPDVLATEVKEATRVLDIAPDNLWVHRYPVRHFPQYRQDILEELVRLRREIQPDLVLLPSTDDIHQDHQVVSQEGLRAFKHSSILGYEMPWNNLTFASSAFVQLAERHIEKKAVALRHYRSQQHRSHAAESLVRNLSRIRGVQAGVEYAEAFQAIRWVMPLK
jgi:LmbE family N-acetylglucosaminyl deacetylase